MKSLANRLVLSHLAVALVALAAAWITVQRVAPDAWERGMRRGGGGGGRDRGQGMSRGAQASDPSATPLETSPTPSGAVAPTDRDAFIDAVNRGFLIAIISVVVIAFLVAWLMTERIMRPLNTVRDATKQLAQGNYDVAVPRPVERELAELADDVTNLGRSLADADRRRVELISEVAHEMRTPLTVIDGYVEGMTDGVFDADAHTLAKISAESRLLRKFTQDLAELSRVEEGHVDLDIDDVDLAGIARSATERTEQLFKESGVTLTLTVPAEPVLVRGDATRVEQIAVNLLNNALQASDAGGEVRVTVDDRHNVGTLTVIDHGRGLSAVELERVFERFYRAELSPAEARRAGTGIGLTVSRALARGMGGDLAARSPGHGQGSQFTLSLKPV